ncbi:cold shock domain-containing protein [Micromonospora sp. CA-111912]|uniref:cold shock domain-containing protein n=1 Tax=Micromonospora sp. CA-111912 TaxID=3239955 RepID=UPI003D8F4488
MFATLREAVTVREFQEMAAPSPEGGGGGPRPRRGGLTGASSTHRAPLSPVHVNTALVLGDVGSGRQTDQMTGLGIVRAYSDDEGWGIIDGPDVPGGCWVHFSAIATNGYRQLSPGQSVSFLAEAAVQDGFAYRAVKVWTDDTEPNDQRREDVESNAYRSTLTLTFDESPRTDRR